MTTSREVPLLRWWMRRRRPNDSQYLFSHKFLKFGGLWEYRSVFRLRVWMIQYVCFLRRRGPIREEIFSLRNCFHESHLWLGKIWEEKSSEKEKMKRISTIQSNVRFEGSSHGEKRPLGIPCLNPGSANLTINSKDFYSFQAFFTAQTNAIQIYSPVDVACEGSEWRSTSPFSAW